MRETVSNLCEVLGWFVVAAGCWFLNPWALLVWVGLTLLVVGYVLGDE